MVFWGGEAGSAGHLDLLIEYRTNQSTNDKSIRLWESHRREFHHVGPPSIEEWERCD
jgi:hypothetical protein